ncbi:putative transcription factor Nin-like family [Medicago truncatula]|uniref:Putative transcription factor Nin-like family n=1 Tax=Medicago truncatula TaxID=3880 RepID=A0A072V894_MEDTR|nr:RWP-RK domain protein [Medicago truncatula]RHN67717.1 putative transcription factor Nin-like family [Medicago truncatula]
MANRKNNPSIEGATFKFDDDDAIDPNFFNMSNPTLNDIYMNNNNNGPTNLSQPNHHSNLSNPNPTNLSINRNNNGPHQIYHGLGILQRGQQSSNFNGHFSNPLSQQNCHGLGILLQGYGSNEQFHTTLSQQNHQNVVEHGHGSNIGNVPFNSNAMPQNDHGIQHGRSGNYDPFNYNLVSQENDHGILQHGGGRNYDPFNYNLISPENDYGIQQGQDGNNDLFSHAMSQQNHPGIQHGHGTTNETFSLPMVQNQLGQPNNNVSFGMNNFEAGSSSRTNENQQQTEALALDQWPPEQQQNSSSGSQVLRRIIHSNGFQYENLEIHGSLELITHAIHHVTPVNGGPTFDRMIDFSGQGLGEIKNFLDEYCIARNSAGYFLIQDSMSTYYETLCTGYDWIDDINMEGPIDNFSDEIMEQEQEQVGEIETPEKRNLSEQRKRCAQFTLADFVDYFHLPMEEAAARMNIAASTLKKISRRTKLRRWPHRKVKCLLRQIAILQNQLDRQDPATRKRTEEEIKKIEQEMIADCRGHRPTALNYVANFLPPEQLQQQQQ